MSDAAELEARIRSTIPLSTAMDYRIETLADSGIVANAPLEPNINIHGTGFAGSLYALGALTAWALGTHLLEQAGLDAELVIARAEIAYQAPVRSSIRCHCETEQQLAQGFVDAIRNRGKARLDLHVSINGGAAVLHAAIHARRR